MEQWTADVAPTLHLTINGCGGDLSIGGAEAPRLEIGGDVPVDRYLRQDGESYTLSGYPSDLRIIVPQQASIELHGIGGDVDVRAVAELGAHSVAKLVAHSIGGDVRIAQAPVIELGSVGGDVQLEGAPETVTIGHVGGDLLLGEIGTLSLNVVGGDARMAEIGRFNQFGHIGGDLHLTWRGDTEGDLRGIVGGDAQLELPPTLDLTLTTIVGGDLRGSGEGWEVRRGSGQQRLVFGAGERKLHLTVGGDLRIKGGSNVQSSQGGGQGEWGEWRGSMDAFGEEMRGLGRELEELGRNLARDLSGLGREIAREVRVAGREARRDMKEEWKTPFSRGPRVRMRVNDHEFSFDPEQIERIKREARAAAAAGVAKAQEAVEQALQQIQQNRTARPPQPPRPGYTGQTVRIENEGGSQAVAPTEQPRDRDAERLAILRMVHEGRLAPDEAEALLRGLDS